MSHSVRIRLDQARMVVQRLERLSADSAWARIASGYRGSLNKCIDRIEAYPDVENTPAQDVRQLDFLIDQGFYLLTRAAQEIGDPGLILGIKR